LECLPELTYFSVDLVCAILSLTDSAIEVVSEQCASLRRLDLYWLVVLTDVSLHALTAAPFPPLLTHLNLSGLKHVTDAGLVPLLRKCTSLTFLDLTRCDGMRDETLKAVGASCHQLNTLLLYATPHVTDVGFEALAPGVPSLTHLDCTGMKEIGDRTIQALARHCRQLRILHLMWVTNLTDASLHAMGAAPLRHLRLLSIHGNTHMSSTGIQSLAKGCAEVEALDINGCRELGPFRTKVELQKIFPRLQRLIPM
jgi:F-box/leucine-rich repeat protein 2/20